MNLGIAEAKVILRETIDSLFSKNEQFQAAIDEASNDMLKYMRVVFPLATRAQMMVLANHGYTGQGEDLVRFTRTVKDLEKHDSELAKLNNEFRSLVMPPMNVVRVPGSGPLEHCESLRI